MAGALEGEGAYFEDQLLDSVGSLVKNPFLK
jgi:hypothetical protein